VLGNSYLRYIKSTENLGSSDIASDQSIGARDRTNINVYDLRYIDVTSEDGTHYIATFSDDRVEYGITDDGILHNEYIEAVGTASISRGGKILSIAFNYSGLRFDGMDAGGGTAIPSPDLLVEEPVSKLSPIIGPVGWGGFDDSDIGSF
jgi:hypothetical protein